MTVTLTHHIQTDSIDRRVDIVQLDAAIIKGNERHVVPGDRKSRRKFRYNAFSTTAGERVDHRDDRERWVNQSSSPAGLRWQRL